MQRAMQKAKKVGVGRIAMEDVMEDVRMCTRGVQGSAHSISPPPSVTRDLRAARCWMSAVVDEVWL